MWLPYIPTRYWALWVRRMVGPWTAPIATAYDKRRVELSCPNPSVTQFGRSGAFLSSRKDGNILRTNALKKDHKFWQTAWQGHDLRQEAIRCGSSEVVETDTALSPNGWHKHCGLQIFCQHSSLIHGQLACLHSLVLLPMALRLPYSIRLKHRPHFRTSPSF